MPEGSGVHWPSLQRPQGKPILVRRPTLTSADWCGLLGFNTIAASAALLFSNIYFHHGLPGRSMSANACFATDETSLCRAGCFPGRDSPRFNACHLQLSIKFVLRLRYSQPDA
jgi:hypothetical protein